MDEPGLRLGGWLAYTLLQSLVGYWLIHRNTRQTVVWVFPILSVILAHVLFLGALPFIRMLALIVPLLHAMKIVVANIHPQGKLSLQKWLIYYFLTVNMNPKVLANPGKRETDLKLLQNGILHLLAGLFIIFLLRSYISPSIPGQSIGLFWAYSLPALVAFSLILHFGVLSLGTFAFRLMGFADYAVFKQPFKSKSISEFWGKRWNLAFSEMTAIAIFKPLAKKVGVRQAGFLAFMVSGLLHEVAISLSVMQGFGLPMLYFVIHGILMSIEKRLFGKKKPGTWWVVLCLVLPAPLLFHGAFLREVIWWAVFWGW